MVNIRKCKADELETVMDLIREAVKVMRSRGIEQWDEIYPNAEVINNDISEESLYVYDDEVIKGIIVLNEYQDKEYKEVNWEFADDKPLVIHRLCIHPGYQSRGIAAAMVRFADEYARLHGYLSVRLDAFPQNERACSLYEKAGYKKVGRVTFRKGLFYCFEKVL